MKSSTVQDDYEEHRDFDAGNQEDYLKRVLLVSIIAVLGTIVIAALAINHIFLLLVFELLSWSALMGLIIFYYTGRNKTKMNMANQGYNIDWSPERKRIFGYETYKILRADPNKPQPHIAGINTNPFSVSRKTLRD